MEQRTPIRATPVPRVPGSPLLAALDAFADGRTVQLRKIRAGCQGWGILSDPEWRPLLLVCAIRRPGCIDTALLTRDAILQNSTLLSADPQRTLWRKRCGV
jgi:hypothetical protein